MRISITIPRPPLVTSSFVHSLEVVVRRVFLALALVAITMAPAVAQTVPELPFQSVPDPLTLPPDIHFGEIAGVAVNSKGHVFVFSRGNSTGPAYMATASQLLEFDQQGKFVREIGKNLYAWSYAHAVRIDKDDNIWVVDKGSNVILKMNQQGRVVWVFGRKGESSHLDVPPDYASQLAGILQRAGVAVTIPPNNNPRNPVPVHRDNAFNQPTDVAWDSKGNSYFTDGYINSRVAKVNARGEWVASWGSLGKGPGEFDTPHGIAVSPKDEIYVADRGNRRIQVLDTEGKYHPRVHRRRAGRPDAREGHLWHARAEREDRVPGARRARRAVHDARPEPGAVRGRPLPEPHLQGVARGQGAGRLRPAWPQPRRVRLDSRHRVPVGERDLGGRADQLARAEARDQGRRHPLTPTMWNGRRVSARVARLPPARSVRAGTSAGIALARRRPVA